MSAHDAEGVLPRAVESIRSQTYGDWELILVDDGSADGTWEVAQRLGSGDTRIKLLRCEVNRGLAAALNLALRHAEGDFVARMDADDESFPDRLQRQVELLEEEPRVAVLGTAALVKDASGRTIGIARRPSEHEELVRRMYKEVPFIHPTVMMRRSFIAAVEGYDPQLRFAQDVDLWLRSYRRCRFHNLQDPLLAYSWSPSSSLREIAAGAYVLARAARREELMLRRGWYAPRFFFAGALGALGLRHPRIGLS